MVYTGIRFSDNSKVTVAHLSCGFQVCYLYFGILSGAGRAFLFLKFKL